MITGFNSTDVIEVLGTVAFAISGTFAAVQKRLDPFGVLIIAFVTAIGGGTLRDLLIGDTPVAWMRNVNYCLLILVTSILALYFKTQVKKFKVTLFLFDSLGLGLFTLVGIQKGIEFDLSPGISIALGTITGCFGGVMRDTLLNTIPLVFRKEIYATASILGGILYFALLKFNVDNNFAQIAIIAFIVVLRIVVVRYKLALPKFGY